MAIISVDSEVLAMQMSCSRLVENIGSILDNYRLQKGKLLDGSIYEGRASDRLEIAVQVFEIHLVKLLEFYIVCVQYLTHVWEQMVALDAELATQMYFDFLRENRASHQREIDVLREVHGIEL